MAIRWDSLMVRELARELDRDLRGARLRAVRLDGRTRDALLLFRDRTLVWRLHPDRAYPLIETALEPEPEDLRLRARVRAVRSPPDDRILIVELAPERSGSGPFELIVELLGNRLNAIVTAGPDRTVRHVLRTTGGQRPVQVGHPYAAPPSTGRRGVDGVCSDEEWHDRVVAVPPPERPRSLTTTFAWTSPLGVDALTSEPDGGLVVWRGLATGEREAGPCVRVSDRGPQPYPYSFGAEQRADSFMSAIASAVEATDDGPVPAVLGIGPALLERLEREVGRAERKVVSLTAQLDSAEDPADLRGLGDLILARFGEIPAGVDHVELVDFEGVSRSIPLDRTLRPNENADRYYSKANRAERAAEQLPGRITHAEARRDTLTRILDEARRGVVDADAVRAVLPAIQEAKKGRPPTTSSLPYRPFRSSGGLEIRVGKGAKHNDDLTFRHSAPNDVWLHARHTAGAHVILRWSHPDNPPARDLSEAAALAALYSKARTSSQAPVDWTRRKYVRKPRGSAPGSVRADRVQTVFVEPDERLIEALSHEPA